MRDECARNHTKCTKRRIPENWRTVVNPLFVNPFLHAGFQMNRGRQAAMMARMPPLPIAAASRRHLSHRRSTAARSITGTFEQF